MDETAGVGVRPVERAHQAGGDGPTPEPRRRMSARRKQGTVLRGLDLELVSRELGVTAAELLEAKIEVSRQVSPTTGHVYGLGQVSRLWGVLRATIYRHRHRSEEVSAGDPGRKA